jgi:dihydrofolate synthase/folylpolyglutamate synthase
MEVLRASGVALTATAAREGLSSVQWPGRLERVSRAPDVFLDGAHNPPAAVALAAACQELFAGRRIHLVMGVLADKELAPMLETLARVATRLIATAPASPRALPAARLAERVPRGVLTEVFESAAAAVRHAIDTAGPDDVVLVCGSLYLVGEVRALLRGASAGGPREILT